MDVSVETDYKPPPGFVEDKKDPLIDLNLTDSTELWLIQWPINQPPDFDGQLVSLNLKNEGHMGTFEGSSGKSYEVVSFKSQGPEAMVFLSSPSEAKIAGKISRRVSLIHYPEPSELPRRNIFNSSHSQRSSQATSTMSGRRMATPTRSIKPKNSQTMSGYSTPSSKTKSSLSGPVDNSRPSKRKRADEPSSNSGQDSGKGNSGLTSSGSLGHSEERKSKKKKKIED